MRILEYAGFHPGRHQAQVASACAAIARGDFRAAEVKKLTGHAHARLYRARLSDAARLLFALARHGDSVCAVLLEVIENHDYARSRFLRGMALDEARIADAQWQEAVAEAAPLRYLHPSRPQVRYLDKPLSFDDAQEAVFARAPPLVLIGGAGSGKTALLLEKLKNVEGEVLYVTHSAYLAHNARELYYAQGFERAGQEVTFLSYRAFVESIRVPAGREAQWRDFASWFARMRDHAQGADAHAAFEEIRGVLAAQPGGPLALEDYLALGVRQSLFADASMRERLFALFRRYRDWLAQSGLYDLNLEAHAALALAQKRYDFVAIDEVQDITPVQLRLVLAVLARPGHFILCGDAHQVVHPNFFSWAGVRALFWGEAAASPAPAILTANFRNGRETTRVANLVLKIKQARFGSVDRESSYLVEAVGENAGRVTLVADRPAELRAIDQAIRRSTRCAVIVLREEDKAEARRHFGTPLLFSVQEAKGLEYESVVLYQPVSGRRADFAAVAEGVPREALAAETIEYRRARDKEDKSLEAYKFFVNALYVALTRAVENVYWVESDTGHPLFALMGLSPAAEARVEARVASTEEWQREAHRLEMQGKTEQAQAIRATVLKTAPVPWPVATPARLAETLAKVFREGVPGAKPRQQILDYAACHEAPALAQALFAQGFAEAANFEQRRVALARKHLMHYYAHSPREVLRLCDAHGPDHRLPMDITPLMAAAHTGNAGLVEALLARGADAEACDAFGCTALHWALREAFRDPAYARLALAPIYELLAPAALDVRVPGPAGERLVRIDRRHAEYLLWHTLWALFKSRYAQAQRLHHSGFETAALLGAWEHLPGEVLSPERRRRAYLSSVLARNEVSRDYAYNRGLFVRLAQGWYQLNPALAVRRRVAGEEAWVPLAEALNLPWVSEMALTRHYEAFAAFAERAGMPAPPLPVASAGEIEELRQEDADLREKLVDWRREAEAQRAALEHRRAERARERAAAKRARGGGGAPWGTPQARRAEIERIRRAIAERQAKEGGGD